MTAKTKRKYCLTATFFDTVDEAIAKYREFDEDGDLVRGTKIVEIKSIYQPNIKIDLVKEAP